MPLAGGGQGSSSHHLIAGGLDYGDHVVLPQGVEALYLDPGCLKLLIGLIPQPWEVPDVPCPFVGKVPQDYVVRHIVPPASGISLCYRAMALYH